MRLERIGWNKVYAEEFKAISSKDDGRQDLEPCRVIGVARSLLEVELESGTRKARLSGALLKSSKENGLVAAVGDWAVCRDGGEGDISNVTALLTRRSTIERKRAISGGRKIVNDEVVGGKTESQIVAANVDIAFIVSPLREDSAPGAGFSRIERSMTICAAGGVRPVVVYNKADLADPSLLGSIVETARAIAPEVVIASAKDGQGMDALRSMLSIGMSAVFFGPSGAGKSSIINALMEREASPAAVFAPIDTGPLSQATGKGLHTTTSRELYALPGGGAVIDTPGMRELALWADEEALAGTFSDIEALARECRFSDCAHRAEPGCRVREALMSGELEERRYENWRRMRGEVERLDMRKIALWSKQNAKDKRYFDLDHR